MGCGKTTIGRLLSIRLGWRFEDGDDFHPEENIRKMQSGQPLEDEDRYPWLEVLHGMIRKSLQSDENMILACSALKRDYRRRLGIDQRSVVSVYLKGSAELLQQRVAARTHRYMDKGLLESQLNTLEEPRHGLVVSIANRPEEIVDEIERQLALGAWPRPDVGGW